MTALFAVVLAAALVGSLAAGRRAPRGPLHVCACGHRMRQQGTETRLDFYARQDTHFATCPTLAHLDALED